MKLVIIFDAIAWSACLFLTIRGLCVLNRVWWFAQRSLFSVAVLLLVISSGYVVFFGSVNKGISYPAVIASIVLLCILDKRRTTARRRRKEQQ